jgi:hypothetical protein
MLGAPGIEGNEPEEVEEEEEEAEGPVPIQSAMAGTAAQCSLRGCLLFVRYQFVTRHRLSRAKAVRDTPAVQLPG